MLPATVMSTRRLKDRDREWARETVQQFQDGQGRSWRSGYGHRLWHAAAARAWELGQDSFQQEALNVRG